MNVKYVVKRFGEKSYINADKSIYSVVHEEPADKRKRQTMEQCCEEVLPTRDILLLNREEVGQLAPTMQ